MHMKTNYRKRLLSVMLVFLMLIGTIAGTSIPVRAQGNIVKRTAALTFASGEKISYQSTDGTTKEVDNWTTSITDCAEGWSWDYSTKTLTLAGINFEPAALPSTSLNSHTLMYLCFQEKGDYTINLQDGTTNRIDTVAGIEPVTPFGIGAVGSLTIQGSGTLEISNSDTGILSAILVTGENGKLTIKDANISLMGENNQSAIAVGKRHIMDGAFSYNGGEVVMESGSLTATGSNCCINADKIAFNGGTVTATATGPGGKAMKSAPVLGSTVKQSSDAATTGWDKSTVSYIDHVYTSEFTSGSYKYKVTNSPDSQIKTVALAGFAKGKSASTVTVKSTISFQDTEYQITAVADKAFYKNTKIRKINIGNNVSLIGKDSFKGCSKLTTVVIGNKVSELKSAAFYKCTSLKKVTIGTGLKKMGSHMFCNDKKLTSLTIKSKKLTKIGKHNLYGSPKLKIKVPSSKVKAYTKLFKGQGQKKSVKITK